MRLVLIGDAFPPLRTSAAVQLRDLSREIVRQGHELTVILPDANLKVPWVLEDIGGVCILRLKSPITKDIGYIRRTLGEFLMPYAMLRNLQKSPLADETWQGVIWYSPSIFHGRLVRALKARSNCKSYLILRDIFPEWAVDLGLMKKGLVYLFFKRIELQQYAQADTIGVQTPGNLRYLDTWQHAGEKRSLEVLSNWLGSPTAKYCSIRVDETELSGRKLFVYAGNMGVAQGMDILLDLAQKLQPRNDIGFLFVGRGSEAERLRDCAKDRGIDNVIFHDEIDPDEIPDLYSQCHAGIVALNHRHVSHNIPGKFLTYMQNRLPVLANVNQGNDLASLVRNECVGKVCETNCLDDLYQLSLALIKQIEIDQKLGDRCADLFSKHFSAQRAVHQIVASFSKS